MSRKYPSIQYNQGSVPLSDPRRSQQIDELVTVFPTVSPIGDRSILEYPFQLRNGHSVRLRILLPNVFPEHAPRFVLMEPLNHPLVDPNLMVNLPMIREWKPQYRLVDALLQAQELLSNSGNTAGPPATSPQGAPNSQSQQAMSSSSSSQGSNSPANTHVDIITQYLQNCSNDDLMRFVTEEESYRQLVSSMVTELKILDRPQEVEERAIQAAEQNLEREAEIQDRKNQIAIVKSSDYADTRRLYEEAAKEHERLNSLVNIPYLLKQLQDLTNELNEKSEALMASALEGNTAVGEFVDEYMKARLEYYEKDQLAKLAARMQ